MPQQSSQDQIWAYFQNEAPDVFGGAHAHPRLEYIARRVRRLIKLSRPAVLNVGIGDGHFEKIAKRLEWCIHSLDPNQQTVDAQCALGVLGKVGRIEAIPFPDDHFDCVVASEVLEHLTTEERQKGLAEIKRTLKTGGYFIGTVPYREVLQGNLAVCPKCGQVFHRWGHTTSFDLSAIRSELAPHFERISCRPTAFVEWKGRTLRGKLKSLARLVLAKCGTSIAVPSLYLVARKQ